MNRVWRNLFTTRWKLKRTFPEPVLDDIEAAIAQSESQHSGELRFAIETALDVPALIRGTTARDRAVAAFSDLRVWDTEANNGVLIYLLLAEHDIEIVADRGFSGRISEIEWRTVCAAMEARFRQRDFRDGALLGVDLAGALIGRHFPAAPDNPNELENRPTII